MESRVENLQKDIQEIKVSLKELAGAVTKLAIRSERIDAIEKTMALLTAEVKETQKNQAEIEKVCISRQAAVEWCEAKRSDPYSQPEPFFYRKASGLLFLFSSPILAALATAIVMKLMGGEP